MKELQLFIILFVVAILCSFLGAIRYRHSPWGRWFSYGGLFLALCIAVALAGRALTLHHARVTAPRIGDRLEHRVDVNGVIRQTSGVSCGPAAAANLVRLHGFTTTEQEFARLMGTTERGTSLQRVMRGLASLGFVCTEGRIPNKLLPSYGKCAILVVDHPSTGPESHAVVYCGRKKNAHTIRDPLKGEVSLTDQQLAHIWHGKVIECQPPKQTSRARDK